MFKNSPYFLLVVATCIWGGNFVAGKQLVTQMPPISLAALRWVIAFTVLLPIFGKQAWETRFQWLPHWKQIAFLAITGVAGFNTLTYIAVQFTNSINASLMNSTTPIIVLLVSWLVYKEKIAWRVFPWIALSMAGVLWIIGHGSMDAVLSLSFNSGDLWMMLAILCWAFYSIGMKKSKVQLPASLMLFLQVVFALIVLIPLSATELLIVKPDVHFGLGLISGLFYIGLFASILAFLAWNKAIELAGPQRCAGFLNLIPLFSSIFATTFVGESIHLYHLVGAALIVTGVYAANYVLRKPQSGIIPAPIPLQRQD